MQVCFDNNHNWLYHEIGAAMDLENLQSNTSSSLKDLREERLTRDDEGNWDEWNFTTEDFGIRQLSPYVYL